MALGVFGFGCEDALIHLLNYVWPNIFETSPHLVQAFMEAVEGLRVALGPIKILQYTLQVSSDLQELISANVHAYSIAWLAASGDKNKSNVVILLEVVYTVLEC